MGNSMSGEEISNEQQQQSQQQYSVDKMQYEQYKQSQQAREQQFLQQQQNQLQTNTVQYGNQPNQLNQTVSLRQQKPEHTPTQFINRPQPSGSTVNNIMNQSYNRNDLSTEMNDRLYNESASRNYEGRMIPEMQTRNDDTRISNETTQPSQPSQQRQNIQEQQSSMSSNNLLSKLQNITHTKPQSNQQSVPQLQQVPQQQQMAVSINKEVLQQIDPFNLMKREKMNLTQLKEKYKKLMFMHHPDRGGTIDNFNTLNETIINITKLQKYYKNNQTHNSLRNSFNKSNETSQKTSNVNMGKKFSIDKFNKIYSTNRINFREDEGYGSLMGKSSKTREDINITPIGRGKVSKEQFNSAFGNYKKKVLGDIEVRQNTLPEPTNLTRELNYKTLGDNKKNFTNQKQGFTDYKQAHIDNFLINTNGANMKQYKSVKELEGERSRNMTLTKEDELIIQRAKQQEEEAEAHRKQSLLQRDNLMYDNFKKLNQMLLE
jgi:hypothetical protein